MANSSLTKKFAMSNSDLFSLASILVGYITRDAVQFLVYSVSAQDISDFNDLAHELSDYPSDEEFVADIGIATEDKNAKSEELFNCIKSIIIRAENKWGVNSYQYKKFAVTGLYSMNDRDLYFSAKRVHYVASGFLADLASEGLSQLILDDLKNLTDEFESKLLELNDAVSNREKSTEERMLLANNLYSYVVKYSNIGKLIWENTSEARYNDYIIYSETPAGKLTIPADLHYDSSTKIVSWSIVLNSTSYSLESSNNDKNYKKVYSGSENGCLFEHQTGRKVYLRCRARNSNGYGKYSEVLEIG